MTKLKLKIQLLIIRLYIITRNKMLLDILSKGNY